MLALGEVQELDKSGKACVKSLFLGCCSQADGHKFPVMSTSEGAQADSAAKLRAEGPRPGERECLLWLGKCLGPGLCVCLPGRPDKWAA